MYSECWWHYNKVVKVHMAGLKNHNESNIHLWDHVLLGESSLDDACVYLDVHLSYDGVQT